MKMAGPKRGLSGWSSSVLIPIGCAELEGELSVPAGAGGIVVFAHGSGSSRRSPRNRFVAQVIQNAGFATLLFDLLTPAEEFEDNITRALRFDISLLANRLQAATHWVRTQSTTSFPGVAYFGASTGAAAALVAAAQLGKVVQAVVSRGGRPDLAGVLLPRVASPTLLIVGGNDEVVLQLNRGALARLECKKKLTIVPGATHLFEEPGTLEQAASAAADWFTKYLPLPAELRKEQPPP